MAPLDTQLLEREDDLQEAAALLAAARAGGGSALLIEGPAGIGKSALIRAVREQAPALGFTVLFARGAELEPFVLGLALPAGAGQVCFERARDPESTLPLEEYRLHCLGYGAITNRVKRGMPIAPAPAAGQSAQRQPCGKAGVAAPTRGAENASLPKVCGDAPICDDPRKADNRPPKMKVALGKSQHVGRFHATITLSEDGDVNLRGSIVAGDIRRRTTGPIPNAFVYGPIRRDLKARVPARIPIRLSAKARRAVKRATKRGEASVGYVVTIGRDNACFRNRAHSSREVELVP